MKTISQEFQDILARNDVKPRREVSMKRRYWNQATRAYAWEAAWTVVPESEVVTVSPVVGQLDTEIMNEFKVSNVTLTLLNHDNRWKPDNPAGKFAQNPMLSLYPFEPYFTKFRVRSSVILADGSEEFVSLFTGLLVEMTAASDDQIQMTVQGLESLLQNANAENVSTRVVNEVIGTGNGVLVDFTTALPGVGIIDDLSVGDIAQDPGETTWSVSQLNETALGAKVTFVTPPASGTIRATYRYWKQAQTFEDLISDLLTEAGVAVGDQIIDSVIFPGSVSSTWTQDSQADWLLGTFTGTQATTYPGSVGIDWTADLSSPSTLLDDFTDGNYTSNPTWISNADVFGQEPVVTAGVLTSNSTGKSGISISVGKKVGTWKADVECVSVNPSFLCFLTDGSIAYGDSAYRNGYSLSISNVRVFLDKWVGNTKTTLASFAKAHTYGQMYTLAVTRSPSGLMSVYEDGVFLFSYTDTTYQSDYFGITFNKNNAKADNFHAPTTTISPYYTSEVKDLGSTPSTFGKLIYSETLTGATSSFYTRSSADGVSWDAWVAISGTGQIMSTPRQYVQVKWVPSVTTSANNDAFLNSFTFQYLIASTTIALANFTGKTCYDAVQELGKFTNYEWGFTADEDFFFRSKESVPSQDITLTQGTNVSEISGLQTGWDRVYSEVRTTYGAYSKTLKAPGDTPGDPAARFKSRILDIDGGDVLLSADGNVASGVAGIFSSYFSKPRRRFKAKCKFLPQVDLSDVALVHFNNNLPRPVHLPGDESHYAGEIGLRSWGPGEQLVGEMLCKVIGTRHDPENWNSELDLEEIIQ